MSQPFLGQISMTAFNFAPRGWATCDGQLLPINQNQALFALLGTTYGGNGTTTFALPDLRGRVPAHFGSGLVQGQSGGVESATLTSSQLPPHSHLLATGNQATETSPNGAALASKPRRGVNAYTATGAPIVLSGSQEAGGSQPHPNMQPCLAVSFVIALQGIFPPRN
jgi:microcystin-dependent protein